MLMQYVLAPVAFLACIVQVFAADLSPTLDDLALPPAAAPAAVVRRCGPLPTRDCDPTIARGRGPGWLEVWGYADLTGIFTGERMAPNGELFKPLFATGISLNIGLLPNKKLYTFIESRF